MCFVERGIRNHIVVIISSFAAVTDLMNQEEKVIKFLNTSWTSLSNEMVPEQPEPSTGSPHIPPTTAADSQHPSTKITPDIFPDRDNKNEEVELFFFYLIQILISD